MYLTKSILLMQMSVALLILNSSPANGQTGYFRTAEDYERNGIVAADDVSGTSSAFGSTVKVWHGKDTERFNHNEIFAYVKDGAYYRFYKYATVNVLVRGNLSLYGLIPTEIELDREEQVVRLSRESYVGGLPMYISRGQTGEVLPGSKKQLKKLFKDEPGMLELIESSELDFLNLVILYNIHNPLEGGFMMDGTKQVSFGELKEIVYKD